MEMITSKANQRIKEFRKLQQARGRKKAGQYLIEGHHLIEEAILHQAPIQYLLWTSSYQEAHPNWVQSFMALQCELLMVSDEVMASLSLTPSNQGVLAVIQQDPQVSPLPPLKGQYFLLCDAIQDPGNLGTMIRTADAAGFDGVLLSHDCVDPYNDKLIRASQGSIWHLPIIQGSNQELLSLTKQAQLPLFVTALHQEASPYHQWVQQAGVIVMGNEGQGVSQFWLKQADHHLYIPMAGHAESLNVAVAAGILMFAWKG